MLGSVSDAEDIVQDAYVRWMGVDADKLTNPVAYLNSIVVRLSLNELNSARRRKEAYIGPWLPEPLPDSSETEWGEDVSLTLMIALERLSPLERAAFVLHDLFGVGFDDIAETLGRRVEGCRKLASRAREHLRDVEIRFPIARERGEELSSAFFEASRTGDLEKLRGLLREEVVAYADGGGKVDATRGPIGGRNKVLALFRGLGSYFKSNPSILVKHCYLNQLPGFLTIERGLLLQSTTLDVDERGIRGIFVVRNPEKLQHLQAFFDRFLERGLPYA